MTTLDGRKFCLGCVQLELGVDTTPPDFPMMIGLTNEKKKTGLHIVAFVAAANILLRDGRRRHLTTPKLTLFSAIIFMFISSSTLFALHIFQFAVKLKSIHLSEEKPMSLAQKAAPSLVLNNIAVFAGDVLFALEFLVGDFVVLWRTWAICKSPGKHSIIKVPIPVAFSMFLWVMSFLCLIAWIITRLMQSIVPLGWADFTYLNDDPDLLLLSNYVLSLVVNGISTVLVGLRTWIEGIKSDPENIILVIRLWSDILYTLRSVPSIASAIVASLGNHLLGLYPTLVIIIVHMQQTTGKSSEILTSTSPTTSRRSITEIAFVGPSDNVKNSETNISSTSWDRRGIESFSSNTHSTHDASSYFEEENDSEYPGLFGFDAHQQQHSSEFRDWRNLKLNPIVKALA
ncbi:hypothetical protein D9757_011056 [Collybiopsis confluens]|uniref:Uncharacterized protein n=1 Tax=Collybiopsis confluens TaxID=2823264 RepID=A0A8H5GIX4_9AGAR|nr:hypothetical protein D9757_011056 [Collybiopsis confluens]